MLVIYVVTLWHCDGNSMIAELEVIDWSRFGIKHFAILAEAFGQQGLMTGSRLRTTVKSLVLQVREVIEVADSFSSVDFKFLGLCCF